MKSLALLRHAKSSWDDGKLHDFERPLSERGVEAALLIGSELRRRSLGFDLVLASPAKRVVETIRVVEQGYGAPIDAHFDERIYMASSRALLAILQAVEEPAGRVLLVGHNPAMQGLASVLAAKDPNGLYRRVADDYPTAALAMFEADIDDWRELGPGGATITAFVKPRELAGRD